MTTPEPRAYADACRHLIGIESAASETYTEALDFFHADPEQSLLLAIRAGHDENIDCISDHLLAMGASSENGETLDRFSKAVESISLTFGEHATFMALEAGEAAALEACRTAMADPELPAPLKEDLRSRLIPRLQRHVAELEKLRSEQAQDTQRLTANGV
jgi:hypothetical protein